MHHDRGFTGSSGEYVAQDEDDDPPAQMFFKEYSGDPFNPSQLPGSVELGKLIRTEGKMCFRTFLAVVNDRTKTVVTLDEHQWTLNWGGTYDFENERWTSDTIERFIEQQSHHVSGKHENLTIASLTPFSLFLEKAEKSWEVETENGWIPWRNGLPTLDPSHRPTREKWAI